MSTNQLTPQAATSAHDTCGCKQATIFTDFDGKKHSIWYQGIDDMMLKTNEYLSEWLEVAGNEPDDVCVKLADGTKFPWEWTAAHYCFGEGRVGNKEAYEWMLEADISQTHY